MLINSILRLFSTKNRNTAVRQMLKMNVLVSLMLGWMITEILCEDLTTVQPPFLVKNFRCNNGNYITNSYFCDNYMEDCSDGDVSDESFGCNKDVCGSGKFKCYSDGPCIDITSRCNTIQDCTDNSDELNCGEETHIENCTLSEGKYLCKDNLKCIDFKYSCNFECNCLDCSDETDHCSEFDKHSCSACPQFCLPTPQGPQCACNSSNYETSKLCREIENCTGSSYCEQHCSRYKDVVRCLCYDDNHEIHDYNGEKRCRNNVWLKFMLLVSTATKIRLGSFSFSDNTFYNWEWLFNSTQNEVNCTALSAAKNQLFYATHFHGKERIFKTEFNTGSTEKLIELDSSIKSMAVDWITSNLYFTSNGSLSVCSNDGRICTQIKCCFVDFVSLASKFGCMFYTNGIAAEGERFIMRSNMDGSEEQVLLDMSFHYPVSLAADEWTERMYWFEVETQLLHSVTLWGKDLRQYDLSEMQFLTHFSILERRAFFIRNHDDKIYTSESHKNFTHFQPLASSNTNTIRNVYAYNRIQQNTNEIRNPCRMIPCHGLCLLRSETSFSAGLNYSCMCENFVPTRDNRWCKNHPVESDSKFTPSTTSEARADSSTRIYSTSTKKPDPEKCTEGLTVLRSLETQSRDSEWYFSLGLGIMFYMAVVMSILTFLSFFYIYKNFHSIKRRYNMESCDEIEL